MGNGTSTANSVRSTVNRHTALDQNSVKHLAELKFVVNRMGSRWIWRQPDNYRLWKPLLLIGILVSTVCKECRCFSVHTAPSRIKARSFAHLHPSASAVTVEPPLVEVSTDGGTAPFENGNVPSDTAFHVLAGNAALCLLESERRKDAVEPRNGTKASSAVNWIHNETAFFLKNSMDKMTLQLADERTGLDRDEASTWIRWIKSTPAPLMVDLSTDLRDIVNSTVSDGTLSALDTSRDDFLARFGCRLLLLPSGAALPSPLTEPPASIIYGKLLYGGVTRFRWLVSSNGQRPPRRAGDRTDCMSSVKDRVPVWMQYGGPPRMYEALDMGGAAVLELLLFSRGQEVPGVLEQANGGMAISNIAWSPTKMLGFVKGKEPGRTHVSKDDQVPLGSTPISLSGTDRNTAFASDFRTSVGGLNSQIEAIVRRVLDGRVIRPADEDASDIATDKTAAELAIASMEAEELGLLGLTPVKGLLLFGPPGTGKTLLAREISRSLRARSPKIVSAPELLDRWVGGSEKLIRGLFADAEAEFAACNGDVTKSALHVVVIDEIDAVFRRRTTAEDSGEATRASAVNQILAKLDGVNSIPNVLLIGMTNRRELLDEALLRPGRLEVQIEVPLPDKQGRSEILQIHFDALRKKGRLSRPLCCAIDGVSDYNELSEDVESSTDNDPSRDMVRGRKRDKFKKAMTRVLSSSGRRSYDLAADSATGEFSGADIAGLVRCAGSLALARARKDGNGVDGLLITLEDAKQALVELKGS